MKMEFFEKPGCINGEKQKKILQQAGHTLTCVNILTYAWKNETLLPFVAGKEPATMMNYTAPAIKNGSIDPATLSFEQALSLMVESPILIKRPLIRVEELHIQGFTDKKLQNYLGDWDGSEDVTTCPNLTTISCDDRNSKQQ
jgi:nitrogenase-associated protein